MLPLPPRRRQLFWLITLASSVGCASGMPNPKSWLESRRSLEGKVASLQDEEQPPSGQPPVGPIQLASSIAPQIDEHDFAAPEEVANETQFIGLPQSHSTSSPSDKSSKKLLDEVDSMLREATSTPEKNDALSEEASRANLEQGAHSNGSHPAPRNATQSPENFRDLSQDEMLRIAIAHSPVLRSLGIRIVDNPNNATTVYDPAITATDPFFGPSAALAQFDTQLFSNLTTQNNDRVFNNATLGGSVQELTQDLVSSESGINRRTTSGGLVQLSAQHLYDDNNRNGNIFPNNWETQWQASLRQPLLRGAGKQFNLIAGPNAQPGFNFSNGIIIARLNNQVSDAEFVVAVRKYASELYAAYWDLQRAYREYDSVREAVEVAEKTWRSVRARREADVTGGEANKESQARADYYNYVRQLQVTLGGSAGSGGLYESERRLRQLMGIEVVDNELLRPVDDSVSVRFEFDFDSLNAKAMGARTELQRQSIKVQQQQYRMVAAKNFLLPQLDMIGRYRARGFGDDLTGNGPRFSSAYDDLFSLDHQELEFGVEMGVTAGRRQALSAVRNARLQLQRERTILDQIEKEVRAEIAAAHAEVASSYATLETSQLQVEAAEERLRASTAMFAADKLQIEFLLDAQQALLQARIQLASDQSRYALALVNIGSSTGTLLDDIGIHVQPSHCGRSTISY